MQISASNVFFAVLGVALLAWSFTLSVVEEEKRPNVLLIMIDTVRADHLGTYGYEKDTSPFLDSLFKRGAVFERAYAPAYLTFQTDAALLSGLPPSQNNVRTWTTPIRNDVRLLPEVFKLYGYETHAFVWSGLREYFGLNRGFDSYIVYRKIRNFDVSSKDVLATIKSATKPFFISWTIYDVHVPMEEPLPEFAPETYHGNLAGISNFHYSAQSTTHMAVYEDDGGVRYVEKKPGDQTYVRAQYDSGIKRVDSKLQSLFLTLEEMGTLDNTIVVVTAEHGEDLGEHGFFFHRDVYENGIRVPLAIIYPQAVTPRRIEVPVTLLDLAPTLTDLAGLPVFEQGEGVSLTPLLSGGNIESRVLYSERQPFKELTVIDWPWKLIYRDASRGVEGLSSERVNDFMRALRRNDVPRTHELFNIADDPGETDNLFGTVAVGAVQTELLKLAAQYRTRAVATLKENFVSDIHDERIFFTYP